MYRFKRTGNKKSLKNCRDPEKRKYLKIFKKSGKPLIKSVGKFE
jgi:hypothetical protein